VAGAADSACGYAALTTMDADAEVLTVEFKINLLAPAAGERLVVRGRVLRAGRTLTVCRGDAVTISRGREKHVATLTATLIAIARGGSDLTS
jgi:acyl-coenzyme A thioesterase PaaI-like protein